MSVRALADGIRKLSQQLDEFAKHPNPSHPQFYEQIRWYRDSAKELTKHSEAGLRPLKLQSTTSSAQL